MLGIPIIYIFVHYPFLSYFSLNSGKDSKIQPIPYKTKSRPEGRCPSLTPKAVITDYPFDREKDRHKDRKTNPGTQVQGPPHTFPPSRKAVAAGDWGRGWGVGLTALLGEQEEEEGDQPGHWLPHLVHAEAYGPGQASVPLTRPQTPCPHPRTR